MNHLALSKSQSDQFSLLLDSSIPPGRARYNGGEFESLKTDAPN